MYRESLRLRREIGDRLGAAVTLNSLGHLQWRGQLPAAAAEFYSEPIDPALSDWASEGGALLPSR